MRAQRLCVGEEGSEGKNASVEDGSIWGADKGQSGGKSTNNRLFCACILIVKFGGVLILKIEKAKNIRNALK